MSDGTGADPVTTEVIRYGLEAAADQMRINLCRTAFSPGIYDGQDFAAALYDRDIRLLAQGKSMPGFLGTLGFCIEAILAHVDGPDTLREGDVLFSTYGYDVGSHPQDAVVVVPGFLDGELIGYAVVKAHHVDIGAKDPVCTDSTDMYQEGAIFPGVRIYSAGVRNEDMYRTILANSRAPEAFAGDLMAQIGSARVGLRELTRLLERFGQAQFDGAVERILDHGEREMREFLSQVPDGSYDAADAMDDNGVEPGRKVPLSVRVSIKGDGICIDLSESADQQLGPVNSPLCMTVSQMRVAVIALAGIPGSVTEGHFRPIEVKTRPNSIFDPAPPAPTYLAGAPGTQAVDLVHRALADVLPDSVPARSGGDLCGFMVWGSDEQGGFWLVPPCHPTGMGAGSGGDMITPLIILPCSGVMPVPTEVQEVSGHVIVEKIEFAADSGGAGQFRGGPGIDAVYRTRDASKFMILVERTQSPPWGLHGGTPGRANAAQLRFPDGVVQAVNKVTGLDLPPGTLIEVATGGGGGFGSPMARKRQAVHEDIKEGFVTESAARQHHPNAFG